jgi:hypothetical protein
VSEPERRYEVSIMIGPCSSDEAETFLDALVNAETKDLGAAFGIRPLEDWDE